MDTVSILSPLMPAFQESTLLQVASEILPCVLIFVNIQFSQLNYFIGLIF